MEKEPHHRRPALGPIPVRGLLGDLDPALCKLHCAVWNHRDHPIDVLASDWDEWVGWSRWRGARDHFNRDFIFTMARERKTADQWLFGGVFEIVGRNPTANARSYDLELRDDIMGAYIKPLVIDFRPSGRGMRLNMETHLDQMTVGRYTKGHTRARRFQGTTSSTTRCVSCSSSSGRTVPIGA